MSKARLISIKTLERIGDELRAFKLEPMTKDPFRDLPDNVTSVAAKSIIDYIVKRELDKVAKQ